MSQSRTMRLLKRSTFEALVSELNENNVCFDYFDFEAGYYDTELSERLLKRILKKHHWMEDEFYDELERRQDEGEDC